MNWPQIANQLASAYGGIQTQVSVIVEAVLFLEALAGSSGLCPLSSVGSLSHTGNQPRKEAGPEKGSKASSSDRMDA